MGFTLPVLGFAAGTPLFERPPAIWTPVGKPDDFPNDTYIPKVITIVQGVGEIGKTTAYIRARNDEPEIDPPIAFPDGVDFVAISTRCMHLGCPVRYVDAAKRFICPCHGGVYDFAGKVTGGPPVRPLDRFHLRIRDGQLEVGPRYSVNAEFDVHEKYRDPGRGPRRRRPVPLPRPLLHPPAVSHADPQASASSRPGQAPHDAQAPGHRADAQAARAGQGGRDLGGRLGRRAHLAVRRPALDAVPQGPEGDELVLHPGLGVHVRLPLAGRHRRLPGDVLPAGRGGRRLRVDPPPDQRGLPRRVRARHAPLGLDGDGDPRLPAHGADLLLRRLQVPARAQLGDRRRAADPHDDDVVHGLPAAVRPALLLGDGRGREHQRHRPVRRPVPVGLPERRRRVQRPPPCRASTRST